MSGDRDRGGDPLIVGPCTGAGRARDELVTAGVPVSPVLSQAEMLVAEHFRATGTVFDDAHGKAIMGHPLRYRHHPATVPGEVPPLAAGLEHVPAWESAGEL